MDAHGNARDLEERVSESLKPGDLVRTPSGRTARVDDLRADGRRELRYVDLDGGEVALPSRMLRPVAAAPVRPWKSGERTRRISGRYG